MPDPHAHRQRRAPAEPRAARSTPAIVRFALTVVVLLAADLTVKGVTFHDVAEQPVPLARDAQGRLEPVPVHEPVMLVPNVLALHLTVNEGAVFGLGEGGRWVFVAFSLIATVIILVVFGRSAPGARALHIALGAVLAGALGNLYDRLRFGVVRDMLWLLPDVKLPFGLRWPDGSEGVYPWIFNVADVCLVGGLVILMVLLYAHDRRVMREQEAAARADVRPDR